MRKTKWFAVIVVLAMLLPACSEEGTSLVQDSPQETAGADNDIADELVETEDPIKSRTLTDEVPEMNFNGAEFRVLTQDTGEIWAEELTGEALNDAVFQRNQVIENRFNMKIVEPTNLAYNAIAAKVRSTVQADDDEFDLVLGQMEESGNNAIEGNFRNWYEIPYVDFEKPWYPKSFMTEGVGTLNRTMYIAESDMCTTYVGQTWAMVYDHVYADNYGIKDVYETVKNGRWTIDKLNEWTENVYTDTNGNGERDEEDFFGLLYSANGCGLAADLYGFGLRTTEVKDGEVVFLLNNERFVSAFEKIESLLQKESTIKDPFNGKYTFEVFPTGRVLVSSMQLRFGSWPQFREYEHDYSYIPLPKWDEAQSEYYTTSDAGCDVMAVLITARSTEMIGAITEALCAESWRTVMPTFCEISLGAKTARDPESLEMINMVLDSRYIDFAYLYDCWNGWTFKLEQFIDTGTFASSYQSQEKVVRKHFEKVMKKFYGG